MHNSSEGLIVYIYVCITYIYRCVVHSFIYPGLSQNLAEAFAGYDADHDGRLSATRADLDLNHPEP